MEKQEAIRPRILVLASTYPRWPNDILPPFVHELARRLTHKFEVHVLAPHTRGVAVSESMDGVEIHRFRYLPERLETLAYTGGMLPGLRHRPWRLIGVPVFIVAQFIATLRLLHRYHFDVIHAHWLLPQGLIAVAARRLYTRRLQILCTGHGADVFALNSRFARWLKRYVLSNSTAVTVVSQAMLNALSDLIPIDNRFSVIPMGIDTGARFILGSSPRDTQTLLFVGRLAEKKGANFLLDSLVLLRGKFYPKLRIIGTGPEEYALQAQVKRLGLDGTVEFLGPVPNWELPRWYQTASILIFPSIIAANGDQEGLGLVPAEALACGCAVIASDLPAIRDVIQNKSTGLLVQPGNPIELAAALDTLLSDSSMRERLAYSGRAFVVEHFDWRYIAGKYTNLLLQLSTPNNN